jgi:ABC-type methionine transport system permease subunit
VVTYGEREMVSSVPTRTGIRVVLRNLSKSQPLVLLVVALAPADAAVMTPTIGSARATT